MTHRFKPKIAGWSVPYHKYASNRVIDYYFDLNRKNQEGLLRESGSFSRKPWSARATVLSFYGFEVFGFQFSEEVYPSVRKYHDGVC